MSTPQSRQPAIILSGTDYDIPPDHSGLAKYTNFQDMSRGGTALLRSCWDRVIGRTIAIKTLLPEFKQDWRENRRLLREARVTAQLQHPNTVPVYEIGRDLEVGLYFSMKRISGENFFEVLKRIARKDAQAAADFGTYRRLGIVMDAAQALAYAHARGVIHRDVKPENIWVGNFGEVILLDWGVAKVWGHPDDSQTAPLQPLGDQDQTLTMTGQRPGTPLYMAPEQVQNRHVDERTDIFSAGVVLYEMLTLSEPFRGRTISETFENIVHRDPLPPGERIRDGSVVPPQLDEVVMKAIAKQPRDRYQSMLELIAEIRQVRALLSPTNT